MNSKIILIFFFQVCLITNVEAQDSVSVKPDNLIGIYSGLTYNILKDEALFEDVYFNGFYFPLYINYRYLGIKSRQTVSIFYQQLNLNSSNPYLTNQLTVNNTEVVLEYSYSHLLYSIPHKRINFYAGLKFQSLLDFRVYNDYQYYQNEVMSDQFSSLGLNLLAEKRFEKNNDIIAVNVSVPFVAFSLINNVYNQWVNSVSTNISVSDKTSINLNDLWVLIKNGELISYNKLFELQSELSYTKFLGKHIGLELNYSFMYYSLAQYSNILYSKNSDSRFMLGVVCKI